MGRNNTYNYDEGLFVHPKVDLLFSSQLYNCNYDWTNFQRSLRLLIRIFTGSTLKVGGWKGGGWKFLRGSARFRLSAFFDPLSIVILRFTQFSHLSSHSLVPFFLYLLFRFFFFSGSFFYQIRFEIVDKILSLVEKHIFAGIAVRNGFLVVHIFDLLQQRVSENFHFSAFLFSVSILSKFSKNYHHFFVQLFP